MPRLRAYYSIVLVCVALWGLLRRYATRNDDVNVAWRYGDCFVATRLATTKLTFVMTRAQGKGIATATSSPRNDDVNVA